MDKERKNPPTYLIWHNSVSPEGTDIMRWSDDKIAQWFSDIGKTRTYNNQDSGHYYKGKKSWAAVPMVLWPVGNTDDINTTEWRMVQILDDVRGYVCWHAANWPINCKAVGVETYARYDNKDLPRKAAWCLANWIRDNIDKWNGGVTLIQGHKTVSQTATGCPNNIMKFIPEIINDMVNHPEKFQDEFNPKPIPVPTPDSNLEWKEWDNSQIFVCNKQPTHLWDFNKTAWNQFKISVKDFDQGEEVVISGEVYNKALNATYYLSQYSFNNKISNGFNKLDLDLKQQPLPDPIPEPLPTPEPVPDPIVTPEPLPTPDPTPEPPEDEIFYRVQTKDKTINFSIENDAITEYSKQMIILEQGQTVYMFRINKSQNTIPEKIRQYTRPVSPKFNLVTWIINLINKIWKR